MTFLRSALFALVVVAYCVVMLPCDGMAQDKDGIYIIFDGSGSMWGQLPDKSHKVTVARQVVQDFVAGDFDGYDLALRAYGHRREGDCSDTELVVQHNLGRLFQAQGAYAEAVTAYERALALRRQSLPDGHPDLADSMVGLGVSLIEVGRATDAERYLRDAFAIRTAVYTEDDWRTAQAEAHLGRCLMQLGRHNEAESLLLRSYTVTLGARGDADPQTQTIRTALVDLFTATGRPDRAVPYQTLPSTSR